MSYKVYPTAYQKDVADAFKSGAIKIKTTGPSSAAAGASYDGTYDSLEVAPTFTLSSPRDRAFLIHECTHAHLDIQNFGPSSRFEQEAVAYLAEAMFLEASGDPPLGPEAIRVLSHRIARSLLSSGAYAVSSADATALVAEVAKHPHYKSKTYFINSNGFRRDLLHNLLR